MKSVFFLSLLFILLIISCSKDDERGREYIGDCDLQTVVSSNIFENSTSDEFKINSIKIENNCLLINFSASGCDGETWTVQLIDSEAILESNPPQRHLKFMIENNESCEAYITKDQSFDVSNLKVDGNQVQLNITNAEQNTIYKYEE